jgi:putative hydrolase of the HAD superfamily
VTGRPRAVLFDLDDTLLDRRGTIDRYLAEHATRAALHPEMSAKYRLRFHEIDACGSTQRIALFDQLSREFPDLGTFDALWQDYRERVWTCCQFMDGAIDVLDWCRREGLASAIVTNGSPDTQRPKLRSLNLIERVDAIFISEEEGISKPDARLFHRAAERLRVRPDECIFVGDNPVADIDGARRAGMRPIWFQRNLPWPIELPAPAEVITVLTELRDRLVLRADGVSLA